MTATVTQAGLHQWGFYAEVLALLAVSFLVGSLLAGGLVRVALRRTDAQLAADQAEPDSLSQVEGGGAR